MLLCAVKAVLDNNNQNQWKLNIYCFTFICKIKSWLQINDKQDQQGKAAFNEHNPHMTQQQEPVASSQGGPQTKTG
jgi:hypothetical protein